MIIKLLIVDDETYASALLVNYLDRLKFNVMVLPPVHNVTDAIIAIEKHEPDILLLDVQLKERTSFEILDSIPSNPKVIFTTAYDEYAIKAIKHKADDYLLKPIDIHELKNSISQAIEEIQYHKLKGLIDEQYFTQKITISKGKTAWISEIEHCEAESNYCRIYFFDGTNLLVSKTLKEIEIRIDSPIFFRIHQSHLINLTAICEIETDQVILDKKTIPVSRSKRDQFRQTAQKLKFRRR